MQCLCEAAHRAPPPKGCSSAPRSGPPITSGKGMKEGESTCYYMGTLSGVSWSVKTLSHTYIYIDICILYIYFYDVLRMCLRMGGEQGAWLILDWLMDTY